MIIDNAFFEMISTFLLSTLCTFMLVGPSKSLGIKFGFLDMPDKRKDHRQPMISIGGLSMYFGMILAFLILNLMGLNSSSTFSNLFYKLFALSSFCALMGLIDDKSPLPPIPRLVGQFFIALLLWSYVIQMQNMNVNMFNVSFTNSFILPLSLSLILTIIWVVGVTNSINWFDGMDGLAAGVSSMYLMFFMIYSYSTNNFSLCLYSSALAGSCFGFLRFNIKKATIIMGDCGSYFLGFNLAALSLITFTSTSLASSMTSSEITILRFDLAFILLIVPIADMSIVILSSLKKGISPFYPDSTHLHHRLLNLGLSSFSTIMVIYFICFISCLFVFWFIN